jgi:ATP-binding cassette subfamily A (ABC1) protein 3
VLNSSINSAFTSVKVPAHTSDGLADILKGQMATYIVLPLMIVYLRMTYGLLQEKEKKIKEGMKIMGMNDSSFYLSWMIYYEVIYLVISLIVAAIMKASIATRVIF